MSALVIEFVRPDGELLRMIDGGLEFMESAGIPLCNAERRLQVERDHDLLNVPIQLPDGKETAIRLCAKQLPLEGKRVLKARVVIDHIDYELSIAVCSQLVEIHREAAALVPPPRPFLKCPILGCPGMLKVVRFKLGSGFKEFLGCSEYPRCTYQRSLQG